MPRRLNHILPAALLALSASLGFAIVDSDTDGMSDVWEQMFGFSTTDDGTLFPDQAPGADPDHDGQSNLAESIAAADPHDPQPYLAGQGAASGKFSVALAPAPGTGVPTLYWWGFSGKSYQVRFTPDLSLWSDEGLPGTGTGAELSFSPATTPPRQYWRVRAGDFYSDPDALSDWEEHALGTNPADPDTDGDLMPDDYEVVNHLDPLTDDTALDGDSDGLSNAAEHTLGTAAGDPDSDHDGYSDGYENLSGANPLSHDGTYSPPGPTGLVVFTPGN